MASVLRRTLLLVVPAVALASVAILNGYPLVHSDTGRYVRSSFTFQIPPDRPVFYSLFVWLSRGLGSSLWSTVLLQSLLAALLIQWFVRARAVGRRAEWRSLAITLLLTGATCVAWVSSLVMSDLFTGLLFVAIMVLILDGRLAHRGRALFLIVVIAWLTAAHSSHLLMLPLFLICLRVLLQEQWPACRRAYGAAWLGLALALVAAPLVNAALSGSASGSRASQVFLLARWIELGAVGRMLDARCATQSYALCADRERVRTGTGDWFLWAPDSPLVRLGGFATPPEVTWPMLRDTARDQWLGIVRGTCVGLFAQLRSFATGAFVQHYGTEMSVDNTIHQYLPGEYDTWQASLQQRAQLLPIARSLDVVHRPVVYLAALMLLVVALPRRWAWAVAVSAQSRLLARAVLAFVLINAAVCGALTSTHERYGRRVVWLLALVLAEIGAHEWRRRRVARASRSAVGAAA